MLICILSLFLSFALREAGSGVTVELNGEVIATYSLSHEGEYTLLDGKCVLVISGGEAYMRYADCPDGTCVRTGRISYSGQSIICLPNRLTVRVVGKSGVDLAS